MYRLKFFLTLFLITTSIFIAQENQISSKLSEVLVTATKTPTSAIEIASSYTLITSSDLANYQKTSALEVLRDIEGISITQQGGPGKLASIFTRGANSNHTLVLIDGIEMNDASSPNNAYDIATLSTENIDRIEVVRGPQSTLYGSEAMAGVINIITKKGEGSPGINITGEAGSNNYYRGGFTSSGSYNSFNYSAGISKQKTDGISSISQKYGASEKDGYDNTSASFKGGYNFSEFTDINLIYRFTKAKAGIDQSGIFGDDPNYNYDVEEHIGGINGNLSLFENKWIQKFSAGLTRKLSHAIDKIDPDHPGVSSNNYSNATRLKFGWQNMVTALENNKITFGVETEEETSTTSYKSESLWGPFESKFPKQNVRTNSIYIQDQLTLINNLYTSVGLRFDDHEKFGGKVTYRIAPAYYLSATSTKFKFTYGTGYKAPSLFYLFDPAFGNPDLKPEESKGWDAGFEQYLLNSKISFGLTYFRTDFNELIGFDENFVTVNIDKAQTSGIEFFASYKNSKNFNINLNYTYVSAKDKSPGVLKESEDLIRRPNNKLNMNINYMPLTDLNLNINTSFVGERKDDDFESYPSKRVTLKSYTLVDFAASYKLINQLSINGRIENIFDTEYEEILYYGTLGRSFYMGFDFTL